MAQHVESQVDGDKHFPRRLSQKFGIAQGCEIGLAAALLYKSFYARSGVASQDASCYVNRLPRCVKGMQIICDLPPVLRTPSGDGRVMNPPTRLG